MSRWSYALRGTALVLCCAATAWLAPPSVFSQTAKPSAVKPSGDKKASGEKKTAAEKPADDKPADEKAAEAVDPAEALAPALDKEVEIEMKAGKPTIGKVVELRTHPQTKQLYALRVETDKGQKKLVKLTELKKVSLAGETLYEAAAPPPRKRTYTQEELAQQAAEANFRTQQWLARLAVRGIKPWAILSALDHQKTMLEHQQMVGVVSQIHPGMDLHETAHFVVYTDIPKDSVKPHIDKLEALYKTMCGMYAVSEETQVFRGKALILAFEKQEDFKKVEIALFQGDPGWAYGICHSSSDGTVVVTCYHGDEAESFDHMLVHETSHGFVHRYKTAVRLPSWVNEGMADFVADRVVPEVAGRKQRNARERLKQTKSVGADFFGQTNGIEPWQYGVAVDLTGFLVKRNQSGYVQFIEAMKEGLDWTEALQGAFGLTPTTLLSEYGKSIEVPDLHQ